MSDIDAIAIRAQAEYIDRPHPRMVIQQATEEADVLAEVIERQKLYSMIQGKKFVKCEGWVTLATLRGCLPREVGVTEMPEGRYIAEVELVRMSDGMVLSRSSAECGGPEDSVWTKRPPNARRSMAITRASGKVCRIAFSWVMALAGYEVTPAEEMDDSGGQQPPRGVPAPAPSGTPIWRGKLVKAEMKHGEKNGKQWVLHTFTGNDGRKFITFSDTVAAGVMKLDGKFIEIVFSASKSGQNEVIEEFRDVNFEEAPPL